MGNRKCSCNDSMTNFNDSDEKSVTVLTTVVQLKLLGE